MTKKNEQILTAKRLTVKLWPYDDNKPEDERYSVNFIVYESSKQDDGSHIYKQVDDGRELWQEDFEKATPFAHGFVRWDGCINYDFDDDAMLHNCGFEDAMEIYTEMFSLVYHGAAMLMPNTADFTSPLKLEPTS